MATETTIRLGVFLGVLAVMVLAERIWARGLVRLLGWRRWPANLALPAIGSALLRLVALAGAVGVAVWAEARGLGLLPALGAPFWLALPLAVLVLDLSIYWQHRVFHRVPVLWRLHRMHHADPELDATTGLRFHPVEILLSLGIKAAVVTALGAPPVAVLIFEVLLNATSLFNHADIRIPASAERWLRRLVVTPDMHRTHHSEDQAERTAASASACPGGTTCSAATGLRRRRARWRVIGVPGWRMAREQRLDRLLLQPLANAPPADFL